MTSDPKIIPLEFSETHEVKFPPITRIEIIDNREEAYEGGFCFVVEDHGMEITTGLRDGGRTWRLIISGRKTP